MPAVQQTIDQVRRIDVDQYKYGFETKVEMVFVPTPGRAMEMGLFGSPTILITGIEVQPERRGPAGFF